MPLSVKRQAVDEYESRSVPVQDILTKYDIAPATLLNWRRQVEKGYDPLVRARRFPKDIQMKAVREVVIGNAPIEEVLEKYEIAKASTLHKWCSKYSVQIADGTMKKKEDKRAKPAVSTGESEALRRELEEARLKIMGLETMIDIAEGELKIDIRKKSGTKQ